MASVIINRMALLDLAGSLDQVPTRPPERRHQLTEDRKGQFSVDLVHPYRLVFTPNHEPVPLAEDGGINLQQVTEIKILEVIDYH